MNQSTLAEGLRLLGDGQAVAALPILEAVVRADPSSKAARKGLANSLVAIASAVSAAGHHDQAEPLYRRAIEADPDNADAWANLGATYAVMKRHSEAVEALRHALNVDPDHGAARRNLGIVLKDAGQAAAAREVLASTAATARTVDQAALAALVVTPVAHSVAEIHQDREAYSAGLQTISRRRTPLVYEGAPFAPPTFALAYHGLDNRRLIEATTATLAANVEGLTYTARWLGERGRPGARARVVVVSDFFHHHTIGRLYRGVVEHLDRRRFEVIVAHGPGSIDDDFRRTVDAVADGVIRLPVGLAAQRAAIEDLRPDLLFYPDIGMSGPLYLLAYSRLAPAQATGWGHPDTTGLPSIDAFVSCARFEPPGAQAHYSERLVVTPDNPSFLPRPAEPAEHLSRELVGLPPTGALYGCPQSLFKLHPDFDAVLSEICRLDSAGHIVIPAPDPEHIGALVRRWRAHHPELLERVRFIRRIRGELFTAFCALCDVLLDPLHFGSGYTFYLAASQGVPTVTCPGEFARGRVAAGLYEQMGVGRELVAHDAATYAQIAVDLAHSPQRQATLRQQIREAAGTRLYDFRPAIDQMGEVFAALIAETPRF